jgi:hypothetical protein
MSDNRWRPGSKPKSSDAFSFLEGMRRLGQGALGQEIVDAIERAVWVPEPTDDPYKMRAWQSHVGRFHFVISDFELEHQGHEGFRGADGMVRFETTLLRLGHELAEHAVELAVAQGATA